MKTVEQLTAKELAAKIAKVDAISSAFCDKLIASGRGHETFAVIRTKSDEVSIAYCKVLDSQSELYLEKRRRMDYHGKLSPIKQTA